MIRATWCVRILFVVAAAAAQLTPLAATTASAAPEEVRVLQLNICHGGGAGCFRDNDVVIRRSAEIFADKKPHVVAVNESCEADVEQLKGALDRVLRAKVYAHFAAARDDRDPKKPEPTRCRNGSPYGNIILMSSAFGADPERSGHVIEDPEPKDDKPFQDEVTRERRSFVCLHAKALTACSTHSSARRDIIAHRQCKVSMHHMHSRRAGAPALLSGDFNVPNRKAGAAGVDADDCVIHGYHRRGDERVQHVYFHESLKFVDKEIISMNGTSDHPALLVRLSMPH